MTRNRPGQQVAGDRRVAKNSSQLSHAGRWFGCVLRVVDTDRLVIAGNRNRFVLGCELEGIDASAADEIVEIHEVQPVERPVVLARDGPGVGRIRPEQRAVQPVADYGLDAHKPARVNVHHHGPG